MLIFPEGGTTNGTCISKFKKGAFVAGKKIKPVVLSVNAEKMAISPDYNVLELLPLAILNLSWGCTKATVIDLPDFEPNEYLFRTHADKGQEEWEIFAWAVRSIMAEVGNFKLNSIQQREKNIYEGYMQMNPKFKSPYPEGK